MSKNEVSLHKKLSKKENILNFFIFSKDSPNNIKIIYNNYILPIYSSEI